MEHSLCVREFVGFAAISEKGWMKILRGPRYTEVGGYLPTFIIEKKTLNYKNKCKEVQWGGSDFSHNNYVNNREW